MSYFNGIIWENEESHIYTTYQLHSLMTFSQILIYPYNPRRILWYLLFKKYICLLFYIQATVLVSSSLPAIPPSPLCSHSPIHSFSNSV